MFQSCPKNSTLLLLIYVEKGKNYTQCIAFRLRNTVRKPGWPILRVGGPLHSLCSRLSEQDRKGHCELSDPLSAPPGDELLTVPFWLYVTSRRPALTSFHQHISLTKGNSTYLKVGLKRKKKWNIGDEELQNFNIFILHSLQISCIICDAYKT